MNHTLHNFNTQDSSTICCTAQTFLLLQNAVKNFNLKYKSEWNVKRDEGTTLTSSPLKMKLILHVELLIKR